MDFLKTVTGKVISGIAGLVILISGISWWRMDAATYRPAAASGPVLLGTPAPTGWDPPLAGAMRETGRAVMEERLLPHLLADLVTGA